MDTKTTDDVAPDLTETPHRDIVREGNMPEAVGATSRRSIERVAEAEDVSELDPGEVAEAEEYLLAAFHEETPELVDKLRINVGTPRSPKWIQWWIGPVDGPKIREIRERASNSRAARRGGAQALLANAEANFQGNVEVVIEGTVKPDIRALSSKTGLADPRAFLEMALAKKQGIIDQLAGEILGLSGYDGDDLQDAEVKAVGNS